MKKNGNDKIQGNYYVGLDIGTESVGWAATDCDYNLLRLCGKDAWGIRLFDKGETAENRRLNRTVRRRLQRRKWRMQLLRELFSEEIAKVDAGFYQRLDESSRITSDKKSGVKYSLLADKDFTDKDYHRNYPTVYHLRDELIKYDNPHDVRLVFLAINHILKSRGHFLYSLDFDGDTSFKSRFENFEELVANRFEIDFSADNPDKVKDIIGDKTLNTTKKSERLKELIKYNGTEKDKALKTVYKCLVQLLAGGKVSLNTLFSGVEFEDKVSFCINDGEDQLAKICDILADDADLITAAKSACDKAVLDKITNNYDTFSEYKKSQYNEHHNDIKTLKDYVKNVLKDKKLYGEIFDPVPVNEDKNKKENEEDKEEESKKKKITANYAAYSGYRNGDVEGSVSQEDFCKFLRAKLGDTPKAADEKYDKIFEKIRDNRFAPKLRTTENGIIANSLHRKELELILKNAEKYLPFLAKKDENGKSASEKILAIFDYKLPYYVGPLKGGWAKRKEGKENERILPWNIGDIIDDAASAKEFIENMTAVCTYTGDDVLPLNSLLYSEYCVLNEINNIKVNGNPIDVDTKRKIYDSLFKNSRKKVTKKSIAGFLRSEGLIEKDDTISGVDDVINANLNSYHDLKDIIEKTSYDVTEDIIRHIVLLGDEKRMLAHWIRENTTLDEEDIKRVCRLNYKKWGRLSKKLLTGIKDVDRVSGAEVSIMDMLRNTNENLMKLLSDRYGFADKAAEYKIQHSEACDNPRKLVDELYVSPKIRRAIWQSMRIVDEIVDIKKCAPKKIFIEVAREQTDEKKKGKRTNSRKDKLLELYKECEKKGREFLNEINVDKEDFDELKRKLGNESDAGTMGKHLYLYYMQFGKCMYSGRPIELAEIKDNSRYDIDHIFPRSKIKDDSFDNTVLVEAKLNRDKTDTYPITEDIRKTMTPFWKHLKDIGAISQKKFERLTRHTPLNEDELAEFINRQLVETRQSTKAVAEIFDEIYPSRVVYSKAGNVSDFRDFFDILKSREVNDLHHANDAYLNIVVGNYFDTRFTDKFRKNIVNEKYNLKTDKLYKYEVKGAWIPYGKDDEVKTTGTMATVRKVMAKNSALYTRMPVEVKGQLFDVQPVAKKAGLIPLKRGEDTAIYGGYNKPTGAYFALIEHAIKKKKGITTIRSLEAVYILDKAEYEKDPQKFAETHWLDEKEKVNGDKIRVIIPKIIRCSLFELDGTRLHLTGRTGDTLIFMHANQLYLDYEDVKKFRKVSKYAERCKKANVTLETRAEDGVDLDTCVYLYDLLTDKLKQSAYAIIPKVKDLMEKNKEKFIACEDERQRCNVLLQVLNSLHCNTVLSDLSVIGGSKFAGRILKSKNISNCKTAYLINQSVTGLFEKKIDLLH